MSGDGVTVLAVLGRGVVPPDTPVARADDPGLTRGDGCFEGCRLIDGTVDKLADHLARMARSAAALGIDFDPSPWPSLIGDAVAAWQAAPGYGPEAAVKLLLTRGAPGAAPLGLVTISPLAAEYPELRARGLRVVTLSRGFGPEVFVDAPWLLGGVKTLSYAVNMAAQREAERRGVDDAIFLATDATVLESPTGSVVWAQGRSLHTTPTGITGILAGTTQRRLFDRAADAGWTVHETVTRPDGLRAADSVWLASSVRGPIAVVELDGSPLPYDVELDAEIRRLAGF